jgi:hypothetical protein
VNPNIAEINPNEEIEFSVNFSPNYENQFYGQQLECYVFYKTMRNFRLVNEKTLCAPWCISTYASGHTFASGAEKFLPKAEFNLKRLSFPGCHVGDHAYQTVQLSNSGDTPGKKK